MTTAFTVRHHHLFHIGQKEYIKVHLFTLIRCAPSNIVLPATFTKRSFCQEVGIDICSLSSDEKTAASVFQSETKATGHQSLGLTPGALELYGALYPGPPSLLSPVFSVVEWNWESDNSPQLQLHTATVEHSLFFHSASNSHKFLARFLNDTI